MSGLREAPAVGQRPPICRHEIPGRLVRRRRHARRIGGREGSRPADFGRIGEAAGRRALACRRRIVAERRQGITSRGSHQGRAFPTHVDSRACGSAGAGGTRSGSKGLFSGRAHTERRHPQAIMESKRRRPCGIAGPSTRRGPGEIRAYHARRRCGHAWRDGSRSPGRRAATGDAQRAGSALTWANGPGPTSPSPSAGMGRGAFSTISSPSTRTWLRSPPPALAG